MPTILRNGRAVPHIDEDPADMPSNNTIPTSRTQRTQRTRSRSTSYLLLLYPLILAFGSLFSVLSPVASHQTFTSPSGPSNYFAGKHNLINIYFVKLGWFWTTLAFALLQLTTRPPSPATRQKHYTQSLIRYTLITTSWFLVTQWFFGPAIIDRSFTVTGGHCEAPPPGEIEDLKAALTFPTITNGRICKNSGGRWRGGHDISGHIFMLVLSSAFLIYESYIADSHAAHPHVSPAAAAKLASDLTEEERKAVGGWESEGAARVRVYARWLLWGTVGLDLWMIMMTAIWFHTWLEKLSGLLIAGLVVWGVYFLPEVEGAEGWRGVVGGFF